MLNKVFSSVCQITSSPCGSCLEVPGGGRGRDFVDFMKIGDAVMRQGVSTVRLGIAHAGRVQVNVYDVAGRKVRTLADRVFPAGEAKLVWDGTDNAGTKVGRGVYFVRSSTQRDAGRIIVLNR
jgi:flagellar hook assembly protein FlgD